jgi:hypothetical protein
MLAELQTIVGGAPGNEGATHDALAGRYRLSFWLLTAAVGLGLTIAVKYLWHAPRPETRPATSRAGS